MIVTLTVSPGVSPVMLNAKKPYGNSRLGAPSEGRSCSSMAVRFIISPEEGVNVDLPKNSEIKALMAGCSSHKMM